MICPHERVQSSSITLKTADERRVPVRTLQAGPQPPLAHAGWDRCRGHAEGVRHPAVLGSTPESGRYQARSNEGGLARYDRRGRQPHPELVAVTQSAGGRDPADRDRCPSGVPVHRRCRGRNSNTTGYALARRRRHWHSRAPGLYRRLDRVATFSECAGSPGKRALGGVAVREPHRRRSPGVPRGWLDRRADRAAGPAPAGSARCHCAHISDAIQTHDKTH
jgi:hypothetical protein